MDEEGTFAIELFRVVVRMSVGSGPKETEDTGRFGWRIEEGGKVVASSMTTYGSVEDCIAVLRWLQENAADFDIGAIDVDHIRDQ